MLLKKFIACSFSFSLFPTVFAGTCPDAELRQEQLDRVKISQASSGREKNIEYYEYLLKDEYLKCGMDITEVKRLEAMKIAFEKAAKDRSVAVELAEKGARNAARKAAMIGIKVFGMTLGGSTIEDVQELVIAKDPSMCKSIKTYQYCGFENGNYGSLSSPDSFVSVRYLDPKLGSIASLPNKIDHQDPKLTNIRFAKFEVDGNLFSGVFFENVLIELQVLDEYGRDELKPEIVPELRPSFNKKYKRTKSIVKTSKGDYSRTTTLYETWNEPSGAFSIQLKEQKSVVTNVSLCFQWVKILKIGGVGTARLEATCNPAMDNVPEHFLTYKYDSSYSEALSMLVDMETNRKTADDRAKKQNISKF